MAKKKSSIAEFEQALNELEALVEKMENGDQSLEEALASFQRGVELTRTCQQGLKDARQQVDKLMQLTEDSETEAFSPED